MKNKGFTLVELLSVLALLSILALAIYPIVDDYVVKSKTDGCRSQVESIKTAAKNWIADNSSDLPESGGVKSILLSDLVNGGYIDDVYNPKTDSNFDSSSTKVEIENNNNVFKYTVVLSEHDKCE